MNSLEKTISLLNRYNCMQARPKVDVRMQLLVTLGYIVAVVSMPLDEPDRVLWFFCYPIVMAEALGIGYWHLLRSSLYVLPLIVVIGIFNPLIDRDPFWQLGSLTVSRGWVTFFTVVLRGLLSVQALLMLVRTCGFNEMCRAFRSIGLPGVLVTQLMMLYRYLTVLLEEALTMHRARQSRGFGKRSYPLRMWGTFVGQLLLRSVERARRVNRAMLARGFSGEFRYSQRLPRMRVSDWAYLLVWGGVIAALRFVNMSEVCNALVRF